MKVRLTKAQKTKLNSPEAVYAVMRPILMRQNEIRRRQEYFWTIGLSPSLDIDYIELVALGKVNMVSAEPVDIFSFAVQKRCKSVILVHNHPSGTLRPSKTDLAFTKRMQKAAEILNISVPDHLIIAEEGFYSFAQHDQV